MDIFLEKLIFSDIWWVYIFFLMGISANKVGNSHFHIEKPLSYLRDLNGGIDRPHEGDYVCQAAGPGTSWMSRNMRNTKIA